MIVEVKVPQLSESVAEATLLSWHKKAGERVKRDENLVDIETDKVVLETPAPVEGVLIKIVKPDGSSVASKEIIAQIDTEATATTAPSAAAAAPAPAGKTSTPPATQAPAMPAAQKVAAENQVNTAGISGSGRGGRVTKGDVLDALKSGDKPAARAVAPAAAPAPRAAAPSVDLGALGERPEQRVPMSRLRARVAERLLQSQSSAAILTTFNEVNMQPVMDMRKRYQDRFEKEHGVRLGFMSFFVKAGGLRVEKVPGGERLGGRQ